MTDQLGNNGVLQVVPPAALEAQLQQQATDKAAAAQQAAPQNQDVQQLASYIKGQFEIFRNHRNTAAGWSERLLAALRSFNGQYDPSKLVDIQKFGGSQVYARIIAQKCRAAASLLRDIYLGPDRPWAIRPPADPPVPQEITQKIKMLMQAEAQMVQQQTGQPPNPSDLQEREHSLLESAKEAAQKHAAEQAKDAEDKIEQILREGGFYHAFAEFLVDLPIFPFAVIKGPVVRIIPTVTWPPGGGQPEIKQTPKLTWQRVSPFDIWFTPGVADIANANVIEKMRVTRAEINELLDLPGYNQDEIRAVLQEYGTGGLYDNWDTTDAERAVLESRENPAWNRSAMITMMQFSGNVQGEMLQNYGMAVEDPLRDYNIQAWVVGSHVIKAHLSPSPRQRHPYFITSFEKVPGTPVGNGLTDLLSDMQEAGNAVLRSLVNNLSIASGPQVVVNDDRLAPEENGEDLFPWKRWHVRNDPMGNNAAQPIQFFMPTSNADQLMKCYQDFVSIADDVSAIPKYVGGQASGGAGRTASGLAMLMGNASKILQTVSANIDRDVLEEALMQLFDLILLTDTSGLLTGEEKVSIQGVNVAIQRETERQRQMEFLQTTANPVDQKIMGIAGRGKVLRAVSNTIGLDGENIVPNDDQLDKMQQQQMQEQQQNGPANQAIQKGVAQGLQQGIALITKELTAGGLAQQDNMPEGPPTHIGTPPGSVVQKPGEMLQPPGARPAPQPAMSHPGLNAGQPPNGSMEQAAARAQGSQPGQMTTNRMGPHTNLVGPRPGPGRVPFNGGAG